MGSLQVRHLDSISHGSDWATCSVKPTGRCGSSRVKRSRYSSPNSDCQPLASAVSRAGTPGAHAISCPTSHSSGSPVGRSRVVVDGDADTNSDVARGLRRLGDALRSRGAAPRRVVLPMPFVAAAT
jgi:hypothetical protein